MQDIPANLSPLTEERVRPTLYVAGAVGAAAFFAAQVFQAFVLANAPEAGADPTAAHHFALSIANRLRRVFVFTAIAGLIVTYVALYVRVISSAQSHPRSPSPLGWATVGLVFLAGFVALELLYRSIGLIAVTRWEQVWLSGDLAARAQVDARLNLFRELTEAIYLPLLLCYASASFCFAAVLRPTTPVGRALRIAFVLHGVLVTVRIFHMHLGQVWLEPVHRMAYLPIVLAHSLLLAWWLASATRTAGRNSGPAGRHNEFSVP